MLLEPLFANATRQPQEPAIFDDRGQYTYQQLAAMTAGLGMYLSAQTNKPTVGILLPPSAAFVASFYGTLLAGKSVVPINYLLGDAQIAHVIADSGIDTVVTIPQLAGKLTDQRLKIIDITQLPPTPPAAVAPKIPSKGPDDLAVLMYTSGTSGNPKGVMLTYGNLQSDTDACIEHAAFKQQHRFLGSVPLFHSLGMTATILAPTQLAAKVIYMARFSPVAMMETLKKHSISLVFGVPSMYGAVARLKNAGPEDFKDVYACISGGEPLPRTLYDAFLARFGVRLHEGFGLTETSPVVTLNMPQDYREGSVGRTVPGAIVRIVDDAGNPLPAEQTGEVWLKGPMVMKGYHNLPADTAAVLTADGFFKTGDLGKLDKDGYLFITGRKKEMIIVSGEKASPREIEDVLLKHPAVADAAVLGKKDASRGEIVVAFVILQENATAKADELRNFARDQGLAQWKLPREVFFVKDLPRSPTGKILKRVLAEQLEKAPPATDAGE